MSKWRLSISLGVAATIWLSLCNGCKADGVAVRGINGGLGGSQGTLGGGSPRNPVTGEAGALLVNAPYHGCVLDSQAHAYCWGENSFGQAAIPEGKGTGLVHLATGMKSTCGITTAGHVSCWGNPTEHPRQSVTGARQVALGEDFGCALLESGNIACWGASGADGRKDPATSSIGFQQIAVGVDFGCAVTRANTLKCWGRTDDVSTLPQDEIKFVAAGGRSACVLTKKNSVACGNTLPSFTDLSGITQVAVTDRIACVVLDSRKTICRNLGEDGTGSEFVYEDSQKVKQIAIAGDLNDENKLTQVCLLLDDESVHCETVWHSQMKTGILKKPVADFFGNMPSFASGAAGVCSYTNTELLGCWGIDDRKQMEPPSDLGPVLDVSVGLQQACALKADGGVRCWGNTETPNGPEGTRALTQLTSSLGSHCGLLKDTGEVFCFGDKFGNNGRFIVDSGNQKISGVSALYGANQVFCGRYANGAVKCWMGDGSGGLFGSPFDGLAPERKAVDLTLWSGDEEGAELNGCGVTIAGTVSCWNISTGEGVPTPPQLLPVQDGVAIAAANLYPLEEPFVCVITKTNKVKCTIAANANQALIDTIEGAEEIFYDAGMRTMCVQDSSGGIHCWAAWDKFLNQYFTARVAP